MGKQRTHPRSNILQTGPIRNALETQPQVRPPDPKHGGESEVSGWGRGNGVTSGHSAIVGMAEGGGASPINWPIRGEPYQRGNFEKKLRLSQRCRPAVGLGKQKKLIGEGEARKGIRAEDRGRTRGNSGWPKIL